MKLIGSSLLLLLLSVSPVQAQSFYSDVTLTQLTMELGDEKVKPYVGTVRLGYQLARGLALEGHYGTGANSEDFGAGKIEVDNVTGLFVRLGGQSSYNGVRLYLLAGRTKVKIKYKDVAVAGEDTFDGNAWGIGAEEYSRSVKNMAYVLEYVHYNDAHDANISGITLGVRYDF